MLQKVTMIQFIHNSSTRQFVLQQSSKGGDIDFHFSRAIKAADSAGIVELSILSGWMDSMDDDFIERPETYWFEGAVVQVTYYLGYTWHPADRPNLKLLEMAPEGITCYVRVPSPEEESTIQFRTPDYYIFCLGKSIEGTYITDYYQFFDTGADSLDELWLFRSECSRPYPESLNTFQFYFPNRQVD